MDAGDIISPLTGKFKMSQRDLMKARLQADETNKRIGKTGDEQQGRMGKDSFLKLLVTELRHQDPTQPMADREFIAQMAQFSSLEQMTNINKEMRTLVQSNQANQAYGMLGKVVDSYDPATQVRVSGTVSSIRVAEDDLRLMVGDQEVSMANIYAVRQPEQEPAAQENRGQAAQQKLNIRPAQAVRQMVEGHEGR